jgi:RNA polymerase sigma-70 factor (ECF subfamily)
LPPWLPGDEIGSVTAPELHPAIDAVWRMESARIVAALVRIVRDVGLAEDMAHDALIAALEQWPVEGMPRNPAAWLMTTARRRAIDMVRHRAMAERKQEQIAYEHGDAQPPPPDDALDEDIDDDLLRLVFVACHPVLSREGRTALTLKLLCGLTTQEIARAFLVPETTMAQRIVRAKRALTASGVPFEVPRGADRNARLSSVLEVIYLVFNEGYAAAAGDDWVRPGLCDEAVRLGRVLAELMPEEAEVHGLVALMELQASRLKARVDAAGAPVRLEHQNRARWDRMLIRRGLAAITRARALGPSPGPYLLQAEIAACHARAASVADTDWRRVTALYDALAVVWPSPVVALNRAVAVAMAEGPTAGLALVDGLADTPALRDYHLLPAVRADLLLRLGQRDQARAEFERAAALTNNARERDLLLGRARDAGI